MMFFAASPLDIRLNTLVQLQTACSTCHACYSHYPLYGSNDYDDSLSLNFLSK